MNVFEKENKGCVCFLSSKPRPKKGRVFLPPKYLYHQDEWLWEMEEHELKSDTSEEQSVEMSSLKPVVQTAFSQQESFTQPRLAPRLGRTTESEG